MPVEGAVSTAALSSAGPSTEDALSALAALAAGPGMETASGPRGSAPEPAAAGPAATAAAMAAHAGAVSGEPLEPLGYRNLDDFAADLAQIWWNAEQVRAVSVHAKI